jgi:hypothetical protein
MPEVPEQYIGRDLPDRLDEPRFYDISIEEANQKEAEFVSKLAVLGVGAHIIGRKFNRNFIADIIDYAGQGARWLGGLTKRKSMDAPRPVVKLQMTKGVDISLDGGGAVLRRQWGGSKLEEVESIRAIMDAVGVLADPKNLKSKGELSQAFKEYFSSFPVRGKDPVGLIHHDLDRLTFGDLVDHTNRFVSNLGERFQTVGPGGNKLPWELGSIKYAIDQGWIAAETVVDPKLFKTKASKLVDLRLTDPKFAVSQLSNIVDVAGLLKKTTVGSTVASLGVKKNVAMLGPKASGGLPRVFIGGNVFEITATGLNKVATNRRLGEVHDILYLPSRLREAKQAGTLGSLYDPVPKDASAYVRMQHKLGLGTQFQDRPGGLVQNAIRLFRAVRGVGRGEAVITARSYKGAENSFLNMFFGDAIPIQDLLPIKSGTPIKTSSRFYTRVGQDITRQLSFLEKISVYLSKHPSAALIHKSSLGKTSLTKEDLYLPFRRGGVGSLDVIMGRSKVPTGVTQAGEASHYIRPDYYASSGKATDVLYDFGNYLGIRLNSLASSSLLGVGFRPSPNIFANMLRLAAIPALYYAGYETMKYLGYKTGITSLGADIYSGLRVGQQELRQATGIATAAETFEQTMPGMSFGFLGTGISALAGMSILGRTGRVGRAIAGAAGVYGLIGGPNVSQSPDELEEIYAGERKVPIRKSRWWALGYQPFMGDKVSHYGPSWYQRVKSQPYATSVYGSQQNYWRYGSWLPTPENFFGLRKVFNPYFVEERNYRTRPYPITGGFGEEIPIVGPLFADTIGSIIKPRRTMHEEEMAGIATATSSVSSRGVPPGAAQRLGIPDVPLARIEMNRPDLVASRLEKYANVGLEPTGIWKFALGYFGIKFDENYRLADAGVMSSLTRAYYSRGFGGMLGETEFIRRFLLSEYGRPSKLNQLVNPIPNAMPDWLPGRRSRYARDRGYFRDYSIGDPYTKIPGGEFRLPGEGYESVNELHSGQKNVYDAVDRLLILSDVAPWSAGYFAAKSEARSMKLDDVWRRRVRIAEEQRLRKIDKFGFTYGSAGTQAELAAANLNPISKHIRAGWLSLRENFLANIPWVGSKVFPHLDPLEHYEKFQVYGDTFANWNRPYESIVRPAIWEGISQNPLSAGLGGGLLATLASGSLGVYLNPLQPLANSISSSGKIAAVTSAVAIAASTGRALYTGTLSGGFIPPHLSNEREIQTYFDNLQYAKSKMLMELALGKGDSQLAKEYAVHMRRTKTYGVNRSMATGSVGPYLRSLNSTERTYFDAFVRAPLEDRGAILSVVPEHMRQALNIAYGNDAEFPTPEEYFDDTGMPGPSWLGWHPSVPDDAIRIKTIEGGINNLSDNVSRFGFYPSQTRETAVRYPFLPPITDEVLQDDGINWMRDIFGNNLRANSFGIGPAAHVVNVSIEDDRRNDTFAFLNDVRGI